MACQNLFGQNSNTITYPPIKILAASGFTQLDAGSFSFTVGDSNRVLVLSEEDSVLYNGALQDTAEVSSILDDRVAERFQVDDETREMFENSTDQNIKLEVYPNPFAERVNVKIEEFETEQKVQNYYFELFDTAGNMVNSEPIADGVKEIHLNNLPRGIYFLVLYSEGKLLKSFKLIKSNP